MSQCSAPGPAVPVPVPLPLRVGLVGCGYQGRCLATAASRTSTVDLVACADPDPAALRSVAALGPAMSTHSSVDTLLDEAAVDAVLVATPSCALYPVSLAAIRAGKHVLVEKPVALNAKQAAHAESEAARAGVTYMAGYSCRFSLARHVHDLIAAGLVGEVQAITAQFGCERLDRGWLASLRPAVARSCSSARTWSTWSFGSPTTTRWRSPPTSVGGKARGSRTPRPSWSSSPEALWLSAW